MDYRIPEIPEIVTFLEDKTKEIGFTMPSDRHIGSFLRTLVLAKPQGKFLELGTGIGLSLAWMVDGMTAESKVISVDNDPRLSAIAKDVFSGYANVDIICQDGAEWIQKNADQQFDLIFADAWPGKYSDLDEVLDLLKIGGLYVIDDMMYQANWPEGHADNVNELVADLEKRSNLKLTKFKWSTGIILAVRTS